MAIIINIIYYPWFFPKKYTRSLFFNNNKKGQKLCSPVREIIKNWRIMIAVEWDLFFVLLLFRFRSFLLSASVSLLS